MLLKRQHRHVSGKGHLNWSKYTGKFLQRALSCFWKDMLMKTRYCYKRGLVCSRWTSECISDTAQLDALQKAGLHLWIIIFVRMCACICRTAQLYVQWHASDNQGCFWPHAVVFSQLRNVFGKIWEHHIQQVFSRTHINALRRATSCLEKAAHCRNTQMYVRKISTQLLLNTSGFVFVFVYVMAV